MIKINREQLFGIAWRIAVLALPWQTRWIFSVPTIAGFPWEQGTVAAYASWIPMMFAIVVGLMCLFRGGSHDVGRVRLHPAMIACIAATFALVVASCFTASLPATLLWWSHTVLLVLFGWTLWKNRVESTGLAAWFVIALVPHALLGVWQSLMQSIAGSTVLGIAPHEGWQSGASVVEYGDYRVLRAYGGFPHPNILGGWLAMGLVLLPELVKRAAPSFYKYLWVACAALFSAALVFTFSRGAWIAALIGMTIAVAVALRGTNKGDAREAVWAIAVISTVVASFFLVYHWDAFVTRLGTSERLEQWSVTQRTTSLKEGFAVWRIHPFIGWGPGAGLIGFAVTQTAPSVIPLEPPHAAPLAALVEVGAVGMFALAMLFALALLVLIQTRRLVAMLPLLSVLGVIMLTDHYPWTLWAGQTLVFFVLLTAFLREEKPNFDRASLS
jgi:O-antigen ligase